MPVENQQSDTNNTCGDNCAKELRNRMRKCVFKVCTVPHNGACQISKIPLMKKGQRKCTQFLRKTDSPPCTFIIRPKIRCGVLAVMKYKDNSQNRNSDHSVNGGADLWRARSQNRRKKLIEDDSQKNNRKHKADISQYRIDNPF